MHITPDQITYWSYGYFTLNATILMTWVVMAALTLTSFLITRGIKANAPVTGKQGALEMVVLMISGQIEEMGLKKATRYLPFIGTLFLFILVSNLGSVFPGFRSPTGSLSTTAALALSVFLAVPVYNISHIRFKKYLKSYATPNMLMIPFNIIGEISRTLSLSFRLFGNIMSGEMIISILLTLTPFFFPVIMNLFGILTGAIQAYIFVILATVYIAAADTGNN